MSAPRRVHIVLSTHWDREWREPFQQLRYDFVRLLDRVVEALQSGELQTPFTTDGQTSIVEDYLEIRPERRPAIASLIAEGKLVVGPWYTMPDEFLPGGESLVRNLLIGRQRARELGGEPSAAGYVPDMFGHTGQLPQILAGFGSTGALIWRGVNGHKQGTVRWRGADGTEMPAHRFGAHGYGTYAFVVRGGFDYRPGAADPVRLDAYLDFAARATSHGPLLLLDTCDHQEWDEEAYTMLLERIERADGRMEFVHSTLDRFLSELASAAGGAPMLEGELREPGVEPYLTDTRSLDGDEQWVIPGVASSRVYLKQANAACESLLLQWAEPFSAAARATVSLRQAPGFLDLAWRRLLENHAHDSIGGCSVDHVHRDMEHRFDDVRAIAEKVTSDALTRMAASVEDDVGDRELRLSIFNALPRQRRDVIELELRIPRDWPSFEEFFGYEPKPAFRIVDVASGQELPYQRLGQLRDRRYARIRPTRLLEQVPNDVVRVAVELTLPALGAKTLAVRAADAAAPFTRHPTVPGLAVSERSMRNEWLEVVVERDGTLSVTDLRNGQRYERLLTFEDGADIGDGWFHGPPVNDEIVVSTAAAARVSLVADGPLSTTFRVITTVAVPDRFDDGTQTRAAATVPLTLDSRVTLRRGAALVDVETTVVNRAQDHRLRVLFPTGVETDSYVADAPFDAVERPITLRADNHKYRELETETKPQQSWTAVHRDDRGLAIVAPGLLETAVRDIPERPIALTLLRAVKRTAFTEIEPEGQLLDRRLMFRYAIVPLAELRPVALAECAQRLAGGQRSVQLAAADVEIHRTDASLPPEWSFAELDGDVVLTSLRAVGDALELRLLNPGTQPAEAHLRLPRGTTTAVPINFQGQMVGERLTPSADGRVSIALGPKRIATLRVS